MNHTRRVLNSQESFLRNEYRDMITPTIRHGLSPESYIPALNIYLVSTANWSLSVRGDGFYACGRDGLGVADLVKGHPWRLR